ncbi:hypothetical protein RHMOL_Rhmol03G0127700 [Rhododendron molle]|uniref:Uncharacterized protein n=1 Tax=Rhododendron molle TaxID=49168 RepID=A0ACC0PDF8_RHOML|nr:hypothetical protein RHMOL_Rhmol03G0127700 [Rhododendron molle]
METEERAAEEAQGPRVTAVAEAAAVRRPDYTAEAYTPPVPHLFAQSGFSAYTPQRSEYDDEIVLRDPLIHIANTWAEEGAAQRDIRGFGGACKSLVLYEGLPQRVRDLVDAAGFGEFIRTLTRSRIDHAVLVALAERWRDTTNTLHLPPGEMTGRATSRSKSARLSPQKKLAARAPALAVTSQRQTRSSQPVIARKEVARQAAVRTEEQFRIAVRERPAPEEQRAQKRPKLILLPTSEDEEEDDRDEEEEEKGEEEEEHSPARSDSDDSVEDPAYKEDPKERADDSDDDGDDDGGEDDADLPEVFRGECHCMARCLNPS